MRKVFSILCLIYFSMQICLAQKATIFSRSYNPSFSKATIKEFLDDISTNTGFITEYASNSIDTGKQILLVSPYTIGKALRQVLKEEKVRVEERNNKIILVPSLTPLPPDFFLSYYNVYGFIKEAVSGEPLVNATVWQQGSQRGSLSNSQGMYTLSLPEGKHSLLISYAGYESNKIEIELEKDTRLNVELLPR